VSERQLPKLDVWAHMGARYGSMRDGSAECPMDVEAALALTIAKEGEPTPDEKATFRNAFYIGITKDKLYWLQDLTKYMNREQLIALSEEATALYAKYRKAVGLPAEDEPEGNT
jgi:hypothetical protein